MSILPSPKSMSFKDYLSGTLLHPLRTFERLPLDARRLKFGFYAMLISVVLYTLVYIFLTIGGGAPSSFTPWLNVPKNVYYSYNRFWLVPSMLGCWILASGVAYLLSRLVSGKGSYDDALGVLDLRWYEVQLNSPTIWRTILLTLYGIGLFLLCLYLILGVYQVQKIKPVHAAWIGFIAAVVYQVVFMVFNR
jgi:hypothetical protein